MAKRKLLSCKKKFQIKNRLGLHARPAALFVQTANQFDSDIEVSKGRQKVNGKSIMGIMTLAAGQGDTITVQAVGKDAKHAIEALERLIESGFDERQIEENLKGT